MYIFYLKLLNCQGISPLFKDEKINNFCQNYSLSIFKEITVFSKGRPMQKRIDALIPWSIISPKISTYPKKKLCIRVKK